jgi:cell division protein FtsA
MTKNNIKVALEIGTSEVRILVCDTKPDGSVKILGHGATNSVGVRKGEIVDYQKVHECLKLARNSAEDACCVDIGSVFLSVTGKHIYGEHNSGHRRLEEHEKQIRQEHVDEATQIAKDLTIPVGHHYIHHILRNYKVDGFFHDASPVGLFGKQVTAQFYVVAGIGNRVYNSMKCVRELQMEIDDVVFAPIATAQHALNRDSRKLGALLIDIGGGTTDYVLYLDGMIEACGSFPVGGQHITHDISVYTDLSLTRAEKIKISEGNISSDMNRSIGMIKVPVDANGFAMKDIKREGLNEVIRLRITEILELVKDALPQGALEKIRKGIFLSGGVSLTIGLDELTQQLFGCEVYRANASEFNDTQENYNHPKYATCIGLIRYAQLSDLEKKQHSKWSLWPFGRRKS